MAVIVVVTIVVLRTRCEETWRGLITLFFCGSPGPPGPCRVVSARGDVLCLLRGDDLSTASPQVYSGDAGVPTAVQQ